MNVSSSFCCLLGLATGDIVYPEMYTRQSSHSEHHGENIVLFIVPVAGNILLCCLETNGTWSSMKTDREFVTV